MGNGYAVAGQATNPLAGSYNVPAVSIEQDTVRVISGRMNEALGALEGAIASHADRIHDVLRQVPQDENKAGVTQPKFAAPLANELDAQVDRAFGLAAWVRNLTERAAV